MSLKDTHSKKRQGKRVWLTYKELVSKFGESAEDIIERKLGDADLKAKEVRAHPDAPDSKDWCFMCHNLKFKLKHVLSSYFKTS